MVAVLAVGLWRGFHLRFEVHGNSGGLVRLDWEVVLAVWKSFYRRCHVSKRTKLMGIVLKTL